MRAGSPFSDSTFRALFAAEVISAAGDQLCKVTLMIAVFAQTGSALQAGLMYASTFLPTLVGGLGLAHLADRYPRRRVLLVALIAQGCLAWGLAAGPRVAVTALLVALIALVSSPGMAAHHALVRESVGQESAFVRAQDARLGATTLVMIVALPAGGILVAAVGSTILLAANAASFWVAALIVAIRVRPGEASDGDSPRGSVRPWDGIRYVTGNRPARAMLATIWLAGFTVVPEGIAAPLSVELSGSDALTGWLLAADPVGYMAGLVLIPRLASARSMLRWAGPMAVASTALLCVFALPVTFTAVVVALTVSGALGSYQSVLVARFTIDVPNLIRGSAVGFARAGLRVGQGLGVAAAGAATELLGSAVQTVAFAGLIGGAAAVVAIRGLPGRGEGASGSFPERER